jgi:hypothetical protein
MSSYYVGWFEVPTAFGCSFAIHSSQALPISPVGSAEKEKSGMGICGTSGWASTFGFCVLPFISMAASAFLAVLPDGFLLLHFESHASLPSCPLSWLPLGDVGSLLGSVLIRLGCPLVMRFHQYQRSPMAFAHFFPVFLVT